MNDISDKDLVEAASQFTERTEFVKGQLVKQKKNFSYIRFGVYNEVYDKNMAFVEWIPPVLGSSDDPAHHHNLLIADCIIIAYNDNGGVTPMLMDSRFIEPAIPSVSAGDLSRD